MKEVNVRILYYKLPEIEKYNLSRILTGKVYLYDLELTHMEVSNFSTNVSKGVVFWMLPSKKFLNNILELFNSNKNSLFSVPNKITEIITQGSHTSMSIGDVVILQDKTYQDYWVLTVTGWELFVRNRIDFWSLKILNKLNL